MAFQPVQEIDALKKDVNLLFTTFSKLESVRFEDFCTAWKQLNFNAVFCCTERNTQTAKMRIAERLMRIASEFLAPEASFLHRVASVYCLYSIYFEQIALPRVKIRMTPTMWRDLMEFLHVVTSHQHLDVAYVIQKLRIPKAFVFTAMPKHLSFGIHEFMIGIEGCPTKVKRTDGIHEYAGDLLAGKGFVENLSNIHTDYEEVRKRLLGESKEAEIEDVKKNLFVSNGKFSQDIESAINSYSGRNNVMRMKGHRDWAKTQRPVFPIMDETLSVEIPQSTVPPVTSEVEKEHTERARKLKRIKEKSFKSIKAEGGNDGENEDEEEEEAGRKYFRRSAMVEPFIQKAWARKTRAKQVKMYKVKDKSPKS